MPLCILDMFKILTVFSQRLTDTRQRISSVWLRWSASTVNAYSVLYQPRLRTIDPGCGRWMVHTTVNPSGIAWACARLKASSARRARFFFRSFVGHWPIFLRNDRNIFGQFVHNDRKLFHHGQHNIRRFVALRANVKKQNQLLIVLFSKQVLLWSTFFICPCRECRNWCGRPTRWKSRNQKKRTIFIEKQLLFHHTR